MLIYVNICWFCLKMVPVLNHGITKNTKPHSLGFCHNVTDATLIFGSPAPKFEGTCPFHQFVPQVVRRKPRVTIGKRCLSTPMEMLSMSFHEWWHATKMGMCQQSNHRAGLRNIHHTLGISRSTVCWIASTISGTFIIHHTRGVNSSY